MNYKIAALKDKVAAHKTAILTTAAVVSTTVIAVQAHALQKHNQFLKENNLYGTYYEMNVDN